MIPKINEYKERWEINSDDSIKPGLDAIQNALAKIGNPEKQLKVIHVAGTNGKDQQLPLWKQFLKNMVIQLVYFHHLQLLIFMIKFELMDNPISEDELNKSFKKMKDAG